MPDGSGLSRLDILASDSVLIERGVFDEDVRQRLEEVQRRIDLLITEALAGEENEVTPCLSGRYTLPISILGDDELADKLTLHLMRRILGDRAFRRSVYGGVFVSYPELARASDFHWHSDGHFDGLDRLGVNFWIPLRACGTDAPGIGFVRASKTQLFDLSALPQGATDHAFTDVNWPNVTDGMIASAFGPVETPTFQLGDALVFTNTCLHRTHFPEGCARGRAALIVRYTLDHAQTIA